MPDFARTVPPVPGQRVRRKQFPHLMKAFCRNFLRRRPRTRAGSDLCRGARPPTSGGIAELRLARKRSLTEPVIRVSTAFHSPRAAAAGDGVAWRGSGCLASPRLRKINYPAHPQCPLQDEQISQPYLTRAILQHTLVSVGVRGAWRLFQDMSAADEPSEHRSQTGRRDSSGVRANRGMAPLRMAHLTPREHDTESLLFWQ
jgi:hypothetical protein